MAVIAGLRKMGHVVGKGRPGVRPGSAADAMTIRTTSPLAPATSLLARIAVTVTAVATAPIDNRSRRNAGAAVAVDRVRAGARLEAARALP